MPALLRRLLLGLAAIGRTRLELFVLELEEERSRLAQLWLRAALGLFLLFMGLVLATAWLLLRADPEDRPLWCGLLALGYLGAAAAMCRGAQRLARRRRPLLSTRWIPAARTGPAGDGTAGRPADPG